MSTEKQIENAHNKLYPEDQAKVDRYLNRGYNATPRKGFKPFLLLLILAFVVWGIGFGAAMITKLAGITA